MENIEAKFENSLLELLGEAVVHETVRLGQKPSDAPSKATLKIRSGGDSKLLRRLQAAHATLGPQKRNRPSLKIDMARITKAFADRGGSRATQQDIADYLDVSVRRLSKWASQRGGWKKVRSTALGNIKEDG